MKKTLYRSRTNRLVAGVCGGFGEYLEIDPTLIRLLWAFLIFFGGSGIILYIFAWIIVPEEPLNSKAKKPKSEQFGKEFSESMEKMFSGRDGRVFFGLLLILFGAMFFANNFIPWMSITYLWPVLLIAIGAWIVIRGK